MTSPYFFVLAASVNTFSAYHCVRCIRHAFEHGRVTFGMLGVAVAVLNIVVAVRSMNIALAMSMVQ